MLSVYVMRTRIVAEATDAVSTQVAIHVAFAHETRVFVKSVRTVKATSTATQ